MKFLRFIPATAWFLLSFYLLTLPGSRFPKYTWFEKLHGDKLVHVGMFGILVLLFLFAMRELIGYRLLRAATVLGSAALVYGIAMEFVQHFFIPGRSFEIADITADAAGSFLPYFMLVIRMKPARG